MRVLLPLRHGPPNKQANNADFDLSEGEQINTENLVSPEDNQQPTRLGEEFPCEVGGTTSLGLSSDEKDATRHDTPSHSKAKDPPAKSVGAASFPPEGISKGPWKTTGLQTAQVPIARKGSLQSPRKRPRSFGEDCRKRPAVEKAPLNLKPAASNMVLGGPNRRNSPNGTWRYNRSDERTRSTGGRGALLSNSHVDDDDDPALMENDPASARGDTPLQHRIAHSDTNPISSTFALELKKRGLEIKEQDGDGNCLFRAVSLQVYGDSSMHGQVRKQCLDFMERDKEHFSQFVTGEAFTDYIERKRQDGVHGNNPEIQAISELFNRPIEVFSPDNGASPLNIFHAEYKTDDAPIRLSYHDGNHYNAVVDPLVPTAGLGLGLPGLKPGLADKLQVAKAVAESDAAADQMALKRALKESQDDELQRAIKESKLSTEHMHSNEAMALSDMDATYFELEQAALEHSLQSFSNLEQGQKQRASTERRRKSVDGTRKDESSKVIVGTPASTQQSAVAAMPTSSQKVASKASIPSAAASSSPTVPPVASIASAPPLAAVKNDGMSAPLRSVGEYPPVVQELVMNGFDLAKVVRAVELIGDNFDDLLAFLLSNTG